MRSEKEMLDLILGVAERDERIRAVYMNGSRTNKNAPKDIFQDYDIVYVVTQTAPFIEDEKWIDIFGERMYMQCPELMDSYIGQSVDFDSGYGWLIQFADGNRLDLHVLPVGKDNVKDDKLCVILLDKDGILPEIPEATDEDYRIKKPDEKRFIATCNEFWWCLNNVAKGLWRGEVTYVLDMINFVVHPQLTKLLNWKIGFETDFTVCTGKSSKYAHKWLSDELWERYLKTYPVADIEKCWDTVFEMCALFDDLAHEISEKYGFTYNEKEAGESLRFLKHVHELPKDAKEVY